MRARLPYTCCLLAAWLLPGIAAAQTPVDAEGNAYAATVGGASIETLGEDVGPRLSSRDLETLVGPVALYPDALVAIILPASAYPLQIVQAARFIDEFEADPTLTPSPDWDESVVALLNYPDILRQLGDDIDWTLELGEAVISQQADVLAAIQRFRDRAYVAGNLKSDSRQRVHRDDSVIEIEPVDDSILYVPVYEPARVVQHTVRPVYSYRPDPYPVYYYPYPDGHAFRSGFFWGLTSAYALGWQSYRVHVIHHSFPGHPFYGHYYSPRWWYRRPTLAYHNRHYYRDNVVPARVRNHVGDHWVPRQSRYTVLRDSRLPRRNQDGYRVRRHPDIAAVTRSQPRGTNPAASNRRHHSTLRINRPADTRSSRFAGTRRSGERAVIPSPAAPPGAPERRAGTPVTSYRPDVRTRPSQRAATYRRGEPSRQAVPKRSSRPAPLPQSTPERYSRRDPVRQSAPQRSARPAPVRQGARQPSVQRQSRSTSRTETSRNRDKARHRLRDD